MRELLRRLAYLLGYQNLDHLTLLAESRVRKVDEFFLVQLDGASAPAEFVRRHRAKVRELPMDERVTHIDLLCAEDITRFDFDSVLPSIVHVARTDAATIARLQEHGYDVMVRENDVVAHRRNRLAV